ncbi:MAG: hypothetical protein M1828_006939 [Chrysothrix sp. TS-e1954]|nr:MAG: hypothetical protein M1828_006939 [Chrysothrix sp. TS-e1954]
MAGGNDEQTPLLHDPERQGQDGQEQVLDFSKKDPEDPRQWSKRRKMTNVFVIALMAILSPLASSMFTPGIDQIAKCLNTDMGTVIGATTGYVVFLGVGPLVLAPLSETFGRRQLYLWAFTIFSLLQIPTALAPNIELLIAARTLAGFFGSVGISNGGGTISDMFVPAERASVFGWYLLGPLLGPTLGPLFGGLIVDRLGWRWVFWILTIVCSVNTLLGFLFLQESYGPVILAARCQARAKEDGGKYTFTGADRRSIPQKLAISMQRPFRILFTQPIVITMAAYQAVIFATMYTLFTNMESIFSQPPYNMTNTQIGLLYLGPGAGFLLAVWFLVPQIDTTYNKLAQRNKDGVAKPEYRLPIANIGSVLIPVTIFWFGWTVDKKLHWAIPISSTVLFGLGQVCVFNTVQNYYIDAFAKYAASAIAAGAVFRSLFGGVVPLFTPVMFQKLGYGWGWSVFGFASILVAPSPLIFMKYGERIREKFAIDL